MSVFGLVGVWNIPRVKNVNPESHSDPGVSNCLKEMVGVEKECRAGEGRGGGGEGRKR